MKLQFITSIICLIAVAPKLPFANAQVATECESLIPHTYDSGNTRSTSTTISYPTAPWIQLDLSTTELAPNAKLILTGEATMQELDADALAASNGYSAVFDGESISVELVTTSGGSGNLFRGSNNNNNNSPSRVIVSNIKAGICPDDGGIASSICATYDNRTQSSDERAGRIGGCTGWLISEDVFVQAGHCGTPSASTRIHFTYGVSSAPTQDQYAVDVSTYRFLNGGVGKDWGAARLLPNSSTGKFPGVAQTEKCTAAGKGAGCGWYTIGAVPSSTAGNNIRITGYGTAEIDSRSQKTHMDSLTAVESTYLRYIPDTTGGNSGSPVIHEETGHAVGIHTHGGCGATGGSNIGTRIDRADFTAHVDFLMRTCTQNSDCDDGLWCNGYETCDSNGQCQFGTPPNCSDGLICTDDICNESTDTCDHPPTNCLASNDPCATDQCIEAQGGCQYTCGAVLDTWMNIGGVSIANLMSGTNNLNDAPTTTTHLGGLLESPTNIANDYGSRMRGWLVPPVTADYEFWIATDDNGEFWLSTDAEESNVVKVCHVPGWAPSRSWFKFNEQHSAPITLVAGQAYYMEALMKEGGGGDNLAIAWNYTSRPDIEVIPASYSLTTKPTPVTPGPTNTPSSSPSKAPTPMPSPAPTNAPLDPTLPPSKAPSEAPTTMNPTTSPTKAPTDAPSTTPSKAPTPSPTPAPTPAPLDPTPVPTPSPTPPPTPVNCALTNPGNKWACPSVCDYCRSKGSKWCVAAGAGCN